MNCSGALAHYLREWDVRRGYLLQCAVNARMDAQFTIEAIVKKNVKGKTNRSEIGNRIFGKWLEKHAARNFHMGPSKDNQRDFHMEDLYEALHDEGFELPSQDLYRDLGEKENLDNEDEQENLNNDSDRRYCGPVTHRGMWGWVCDKCGKPVDDLYMYDDINGVAKHRKHVNNETVADNPLNRRSEDFVEENPRVPSRESENPSG